MTLLLQPSPSRDPDVLQRIVGALDAAFDYYATTAGRVPVEANSLNGRTEIAEVHSTCGAGCSYIGSTGMEIMIEYFDILYRGVEATNTFDQVLFYEFGRNFWFWSDALAFKAPEDDPVITGYAVWMRFRSMAAAGVAGAPYNGMSFEQFEAQVSLLVDEYERDVTHTFAETLALNRSPGAFGGTDFWASIMMRLARDYGGQRFVERFWRTASKISAAETTREAVSNWISIAGAAAGTDLSGLFYERWRFPRP